MRRLRFALAIPAVADPRIEVAGKRRSERDVILSALPKLAARGWSRSPRDRHQRASAVHARTGRTSGDELIAHIERIDDPILGVRLLGGRTGARGFAQQSLQCDTGTRSPDPDFVEVGGVGMRLDLARMSFPANDFDLAYSIEHDDLLGSISVGLSM